jgi:hypothetical protein
MFVEVILNGVFELNINIFQCKNTKIYNFSHLPEFYLLIPYTSAPIEGIYFSLVNILLFREEPIA